MTTLQPIIYRVEQEVGTTNLEHHQSRTQKEKLKKNIRRSDPWWSMFHLFPSPLPRGNMNKNILLVSNPIDQDQSQKLRFGSIKTTKACGGSQTPELSRLDTCCMVQLRMFLRIWCCGFWMLLKPPDQWGTNYIKLLPTSTILCSFTTAECFQRRLRTPSYTQHVFIFLFYAPFFFGKNTSGMGEHLEENCGRIRQWQIVKSSDP